MHQNANAKCYQQSEWCYLNIQQEKADPFDIVNSLIRLPLWQAVLVLLVSSPFHIVMCSVSRMGAALPLYYTTCALFLKAEGCDGLTSQTCLPNNVADEIL